MRHTYMVVGDADIDRIAGELIRKHGPQAARVAAERLNAMIDSKDLKGRDVWACIVRVIHQQQGSGAVQAERRSEADR